MPPDPLTCETCLAKVRVTYADLGRILRVRCPEHGGLVLRDDAKRQPPAAPRPSLVRRVRKTKRKRGLPEIGPGVTVTLRERQRQNVLVIHRPGDALDALREVCQTADRLDGDWRVLTVSTPATILRDLQGVRPTEGESWPEATMLGQIGRADLLEAPA